MLTTDICNHKSSQVYTEWLHFYMKSLISEPRISYDIEYMLCEHCHMLSSITKTEVPMQPGLSWWRHQMETVTRSFDVFLICTRTNGWVNNREAGDLRHHRAHYDVIVIFKHKEVLMHNRFQNNSIIRMWKNIQRVPLFHDLSLHDGKRVILLIWWW